MNYQLRFQSPPFSLYVAVPPSSFSSSFFLYHVNSLHIISLKVIPFTCPLSYLSNKALCPSIHSQRNWPFPCSGNWMLLVIPKGKLTRQGAMLVLTTRLYSTKSPCPLHTLTPICVWQVVVLTFRWRVEPSPLCVFPCATDMYQQSTVTTTYSATSKSPMRTQMMYSVYQA